MTSRPRFVNNHEQYGASTSDIYSANKDKDGYVVSPLVIPAVALLLGALAFISGNLSYSITITISTYHANNILFMFALDSACFIVWALFAGFFDHMGGNCGSKLVFTWSFILTLAFFAATVVYTLAIFGRLL